MLRHMHTRRSFSMVPLILLLISSARSDDCEPWPRNIPNLHECCVFPHYLDLYAYAECMKHCLENHEDDETCVLHCYINVTNIIHDDELDAHAVKEIYMENVDTKAWEGVIAASIGTCKSVLNVSDHASLQRGFFEFFACVKEESLPSCLEFYGTNECYESEKHFLQCHNVSLSCDTWPERFPNETLVNCCNFPQLFDDHFTETCEMRCVFAADVLACIEKCRYFETGIVSKGAIDAEAIRRRICEHRHYHTQWDAIIDEAVGTCLGEYYVQHANNSNSFSYSQFESCIDFRMSAACLEVRTDVECRTLRSFMERCPDTRPEGFITAKRDSRSIGDESVNYIF